MPMQEDWEFGALFIAALALLPFGEYASIIGMVAVFALISYLKK